MQDVGKALIGFFFLLWKSVESTLFRNVQREVIHTSGCLNGFLIRVPTSTGRAGAGRCGAGVYEGPRPPVARVGSGKEQRAEGNWMLLQDTKEKE